MWIFLQLCKNTLFATNSLKWSEPISATSQQFLLFEVVAAHFAIARPPSFFSHRFFMCVPLRHHLGAHYELFTAAGDLSDCSASDDFHFFPAAQWLDTQNANHNATANIRELREAHLNCVYMRFVVKTRVSDLVLKQQSHICSFIIIIASDAPWGESSNYSNCALLKEGGLVGPLKK